MKKIIDYLRNKPEKTRTHILHVFMFVASLCILSIWVYSLGTQLGSKDIQVKAQNDLKPFSALKGNLIDGYYSISGSN